MGLEEASCGYPTWVCRPGRGRLVTLSHRPSLKKYNTRRCMYPPDNKSNQRAFQPQEKVLGWGGKKAGMTRGIRGEKHGNVK